MSSKNNRVRGRIRVDVNGRVYFVELRTSGLSVRKIRQRKGQFISASDIIDMVTGQGHLALWPNGKDQ